MDNTLAINYANACNAYLCAFCRKHGYSENDPETFWVSNNVGGVVCVSDLFISMQTIIDDIEMNAPEDELIKWYDYCIVIASISEDIATPSFSNWLKGCPRMSQGEIDTLIGLKGKVHSAELALMDEINNYKENSNENSTS